MLYKIIEGYPSNVQSEVQQHLEQGWELNGVLMARIHQDGHHLMVQGLVHNNPETLNSGQQESILSPAMTLLLNRATGRGEQT